MLKTKVFKNFRIFDENDGFKTDIVCNFCRTPSELYIKITDGVLYDPTDIYICKTCLTRNIEKLDKEFIEHCKTDKRK